MWGRVARRASKSLDRDGGRSQVTRLRRHTGQDEKGFTLIELIIVVSVMPIIVGAITAGLVTIISLQSSTSGRLGDSGNAQIVSSTFIKDVQSATFITTDAMSTPQCGSSSYTQLLGLQWGNSQSDIANGISSAPSTWVSYDIVPVTNGSTTTYSLVREYCTLGNSSNPSSTTVADDIAGPGVQPPPCTSSAGCNPYDTAHNTPIGWTSPASVPLVNFEITELNSGYEFTLSANSLAWTPPGANSGTNGPAFSPLTLLSKASGTGSDLNMSNGSILTITGSGTAGTTMALASPNDSSASVPADAALSASTVFTEDPNLASLAPLVGGGLVNLQNIVTGTPQFYASSISDPLSSTFDAADAPPASSAWPLPGPVTCSKVGLVYKCPPGDYTADPGFVSGSTVCFCGYDGGGGYGNYEFAKTFMIPLNSTITFNQGEYVFDGANNGSAAIAPDSGSGATTIVGNNVTFYVPPTSGTVNFGSGSSVELTPLGSYPTIWDLSTSSVTINNVANNRNTYGGIYVPGGTVNAANSTVSGTMSVMYVIAQSLTLNPQVDLNVTGP
jgi:prepilin-type N-terminal cleavage/methylation domain-containing protein